MSKGNRKEFTTLWVIVFLGFFGVSMPYLIFPALFINPEYSILPLSWASSYRAVFLGITLAAYPLGQFFGSPILGALSDDYGRKILLAGSLIASACFNALTGVGIHFGTLWLIIVTRFLAGFMEGNIAIARAMAADMKGLSKHETFGKINAAASIAFFLGPLLGGLLADRQLFDAFTPSTPFYVISVLFVPLAFLAAGVLKEKGPSIIGAALPKKSLATRINVPQQLSRLFQNKKLRFLMIISTLFTLSIDIFYEFGPVYLTVKWMFGPAQLIVYNSVLCLSLAFGNGWFASFISKRYNIHYWIVSAMIGFSLLLIGMVVTNSVPLMIALFGLSGILIGIGVTFLTVKISDSVTDAIQGEVMGAQLSLRVLGDAFICLVGGALLLISPKVILICAALVALLAMIHYQRKSRV